MPNPITPSLLGLQKATGIGADPAATAFRQMDQQRQDASLPNPEQKGASALDMLSRLAREYHGPVQETLGEVHPDFTPVGGEGLYNVAKGAVLKAGDTAETAYRALMSKLGGLGR